jgi:hypothetical protein
MRSSGIQPFNRTNNNLLGRGPTGDPITGLSGSTFRWQSSRSSDMNLMHIPKNLLQACSKRLQYRSKTTQESRA